MAVVHQFKNLFSRNVHGREQDTHFSLGDSGISILQSDEEIKSAQSGYGTLSRKPSRADTPKTRGTSDQITLPFLGAKAVVLHQRVLSMTLGLSLILLTVVTVLGLNQSERVAQQLHAAGRAQTHSQRLAKEVTQALFGRSQSFTDMTESAQILSDSVRGMRTSDAGRWVRLFNVESQPLLERLTPLLDRTAANAATFMAQKNNLIQANGALRLITQQSADMLSAADTVFVAKLQQNVPQAELLAAHQLVVLTQRISRSANQLLTMDGVDQDAAGLLAKDLKLFGDILTGRQEGSPELRLSVSSDAKIRDQLNTLQKLHAQNQARASSILGYLPSLVSAREAQFAILTDSSLIRQELESLQVALSSHTDLSTLVLIILLLAVLLALLSAAGLSYVQLQDSRQRQVAAESLQQEARHHEQEAKRVNDANQAAILRLMNELQTVAEGDLTQEATVTEDITGAIADSVNYTIEELRSLVGHVQSMAARVAQTTSDVDANSTELLAASNEQLHEIRETGRSVLDMATRINQVSVQAQESALVARQSLKAADLGLQAVQNSIGGMNTIRDQIQETSKRIKRLGESSQEIGEITELISDITEQTNILALNAAIQAASAGDAGRGFSVVAEEVQRLAERSADAARQIAALVKAIQTDTQDATGAMERSTQGVVEGAKLSDNAGTALTEIDHVSRHLADLIEQISSSTLREAKQANDMAGNIQHIFAVTEQTVEGTRSTATQVRSLSKMAEDLRQSVARFRIA